MTPITVTLTGTTPLLCGRPASEPLPADATPRTQAAARLYLDQAGLPVLPGVNLLRCLIGAAQERGKSATEFVHFLGIQEHEVRIGAKRPWVVDTRSVRLPSGERALCHRPRFDDWRLVFTLLVDIAALPEVEIRCLADLAGQRIGLGDYRPERSGTFGRFAVSGWEVR